MSVVGIDPATYAALLLAPTLSQGYDADLKFKSERYRLWLPRVTDADAESYGLPLCPVDVEVFNARDGRWVAGDDSDMIAALNAARVAGLL